MTVVSSLALVLAGGAGSRMGALTDRRAKPALPFAGHYRLVDFPLSNCANSRIDDVWVLQQYQPHALEDHLANGRPWDLDRSSGGLLILHPFTGGAEGGFNEGNADAIWRHRHLITEQAPDVVLVLSADAVYTFDYRDLIERHLAQGADVTMATTRVDDPSRFGVVEVDGDGRVTGFAYKPDDPAGDLATIEVFAFRTSALLTTLDELRAGDEDLADFGDALIPALVDGGKAYEHRFERYWRDLGTPDSYWEAHQDLVAGETARRGLDLDDGAWPIRTRGAQRPPARLDATAAVESSLVSPACRLAGRVVRSVLSPGVVVEEGAVVEDAVVLHDAVIRAGARVRRAIVDSGVEIAPGDRVGPAGDGSVTVVGGDGTGPDD